MTGGAPAGAAREFYLDEDLGDVAPAGAATDRWRVVPRDAVGPARALTLRPGEQAGTPPLTLTADVRLACELLVVGGSPDAALEATIGFEAPGERETLVAVPLGPSRAPRAIELGLAAFAGRTGRFWIACRRAGGSPADDAVLAVVDWVVGRVDRLGLLRARSHPRWRLGNELAHFEHLYADAFFDPRRLAARPGDGRAPAAPAPANAVRLEPELDAGELARRPYAAPLDGENAYTFAMRVLTALIRTPVPDFAARLRALAEGGRVPRLLSICCGAAGVELGIIRAAGVQVDVTLFDINPALLEQAASAAAPDVPVRTVRGDVNAMTIEQFDGNFDAIACVSGLHHVVELERVLDAASRLLVPGGEFWVIGEAVGRDGNRLWPEERAAADALFGALPERCRRNAHTGAVDAVIPDTDYSASSLEGVRSSEVEAALSNYFEVEATYRRNCFLWRILDMAYYANYDVRDPDDRRRILALVAAEYNHWKHGGRSAETFAVYRAR